MWVSVSLFFTPIYFSLLHELISYNSSQVVPSNDYTGLSFGLEELKALEEFRSLVADVIRPNDPFSDDIFLMLWLRREKFNLDSTYKKYRKALQWRKENKMESILNETILEYAPDLCWVDGTAKDGSPILSARIGGLDVRRSLMAGLGNSMTRKLYQCVETLLIKSIEMSKSTGKVINQAIAIFDSAGLNTKQHGCIWCMQFAFRFLREIDEFMPDALKLIVVVNAPLVAKPMLDIALPLIDPARRNGIKMFGVDNQEWSSFLGNIISPDQLSVKFGDRFAKVIKEFKDW